MAETSGSGGVGALSIAGIATVVVIVGGVVLTQFGVFDGAEDVAETPVVAEQPVPEASSAASPSVAAPDPAPVEQDQTAAEPPVAETVPSPETPVATAGDGATEDTVTGTVPAEAVTPEPDTDTEQVVTEASPATPADTERDVAADPVTTAPEGPDEADTTDQARAEEAATSATTPADEPANDPTVAVQAPEIDVIRFDPDGAGLIAGRALAGARVLILLDGIVIEEATASGSGEFVAFPVVEPAAEPRVVTVATGKGAEIVASDVSFILAPVTPVAVAEAEVTPEPIETPTEAAPIAEQAAAPEVAETPSEPENVTAAEVVQAENAQQDDPEAASEAPQLATVVDVETPAQPTVPDVPDLSAVEVAEQVVADVPAQAETTSQDEDGANSQTLALLQTQNAPAAPEQAADPVDQTVATQEQEAPKPQSAAIAVLRAGPEGVEVVQPVAPSTPELADKVALDAISYTPTGDVVLTGRARPAALVRVYIDNEPVVDVRTNVSGRWRTGLDGVAPGFYTLRLDEIDPLEGKVLSRLETPFKREAPDVLVQPTPEPGAPVVETSVRAVTVQKGDTLWAISQARYGDGFLFVRVFEANKEAIRNPDLIYPGQIFNLPE